MDDDNVIRIKRSPHDKKNPYFMTVRETAQDKTISFGALGLLTYLLSKPDHWQIIIGDLTRVKCGRDKARTLVNELIKACYIVKYGQTRGDGSKFTPVYYDVYEAPSTENPSTENPSTENPSTENPTLDIKELESIEKKNPSPPPQAAENVKTPPAITQKNVDSSSAEQGALTCEGCLFVQPSGVCSSSSSLHRVVPRCDQYTPVTDEHRKAIAAVEYGVPFEGVFAQGKVEDETVFDAIKQASSPPTDIFEITPGGQWAETAPKTLPLAQKITAARDEHATIKLDPEDLTKRDWSLLGQALYAKKGNASNHMVCLATENERMGVFVAAGILRALNRQSQYALTNDGREWVDTFIDTFEKGAYREAGIQAQEKYVQDKRDKERAKAARRRQPATPKKSRRKFVTPDTEPMYNRINLHWGEKPVVSTDLTVTEHNARRSVAIELTNISQPPTGDEIAGVYRYSCENHSSRTIWVLAKHLGAYRDAVTQKQTNHIEIVDDSAPLSSSDGIAYVANDGGE